jgi:hypothetical protein
MRHAENSHLPLQATVKPRLLDQVRGVLRRKHYSIRTEQSYVDWGRGVRSPLDGAASGEARRGQTMGDGTV